MQKLDWYIARTLFVWTAIVLVVLVSFRSISVLIDEMDLLGRHDYGMLQVLIVVFMKTPAFFYELFPVGLLLGGLLGLGGMAKHREIIALRAAGVSVRRLLLGLVKAGAIMVAFGLLVGEVAAPAIQQQAEQMRAEWLKYPSVLQTKYGVWVRDDKTYINIRRIRPDGELQDITTYHFLPNGKMRLMRQANRAVFADEGWMLRGVKETRFLDGKVESSNRKRVKLEAQLDPDMMSKLGIEPEMLSIQDLFEYNQFLERNNQSVPEYQLAFWNKLAIPVISILMLILALPFVISNMREIDIGQRLVAGSIIGVVLFLVTKSANFIGLIYDVSPFLVTWSPVLLLAITVAFLMRRIA